MTVANALPGDDPEAPLFFWGRTPVGSVWRFHRDLPDSVLREVGRLAAAERVSDSLEREPERLAPIREWLERVRPIEQVWSGPAYRFPDSLPVPTDARLLDVSELDRVAAAFPQHADALPHRGPWAAVVHDGQVASLCCSATGTGHAVEAGVDTQPAFRGRGFAVEATLAWAASVQAVGREPLYSTSWQNRASRRVARKLGLILYGCDLHLR